MRRAARLREVLVPDFTVVSTLRGIQPLDTSRFLPRILRQLIKRKAAPPPPPPSPPAALLSRRKTQEFDFVISCNAVAAVPVRVAWAQINPITTHHDVSLLKIDFGATCLSGRRFLFVNKIYSEKGRTSSQTDQNFSTFGVRPPTPTEDGRYFDAASPRRSRRSEIDGLPRIHCIIA